MFDYSSYQADPKAGENSAPLDPNHTHFILVDNAHQNVFGGEIEFRARLETEIVSYKSQGGGCTDDHAPIVVLVVEGGPGTFRTVLNSVKNGSPCVFIEGSGGCADIYAFALSKLAVRFHNSKGDKLRA
jgi:transient receptor potential cation channel subfamily M protein 2